MKSKEEKIVKIDLNLLKKKIVDAKDDALARIKEKRNAAVSSVLGKSIEITKKQVNNLENVKKNFD